MAQRSNPPASDGPLAGGTRLGGVRIERLLRRGAIGALYLAIQETDGAPLAVKAVPLGQHAGATPSAAQQDFSSESTHAVRLRQPGIVTTYGALVHEGVGYMAPQLLGGARADAASDLYALGVLLLELLTGRLPFEGTSMGALLRAMTSGAPQTVRALRAPTCPPRRPKRSTRRWRRS